MDIRRFGCPTSRRFCAMWEKRMRGHVKTIDRFLSGRSGFAIVLLACAGLAAQSAPPSSNDENVHRDSSGKILMSGSASSPGKAIEEAAQAAARHHGSFGPIDILSDTQGVDFGPYLHNLLSKVRSSCYALIPASAQSRKGEVVIEYAIQRNGQLANMRLVTSSGDAPLDRAAWEGIKGAAPFPPLPPEFKGDRLSLRIDFLYNELGHRFTHATIVEPVTANAPTYPRKAVLAGVDGLVRLEATVGVNGKVEDVKVLEGDAMLAEACTDAVKRWRFYPAQRNHVPVQDLVRIKVEFRLDGEQVRAQVVWPEVPASALPSQ